MSVRQDIAKLARSKKPMSIWTRTDSPTTTKAIRRSILQYMDETTKPTPAGAFVPTPDMVRRAATDMLTEGLRYLTKEETGKLKAYGFIRDDVVRRTGRYPQMLSNSELVQASCEAWMERLGRKSIKRTAHKYVLALNPELCELLWKTGHSGDELLTNSVRRMLRKYQEKFYPDQKLGYLLGIHHDKAHLHAHVMLFPTTEDGKLLRVTDEGKGQAGKKPFTFMRKYAQQLVQEFFEMELQRPAQATNRSLADVYQPRLLTRAAQMKLDAAAEAGNEELKQLTGDRRWQWIQQEKQRLQTLDQATLRQVLQGAYETEQRNYARAREGIKRPGVKEKLTKVVRAQIDGLQADLGDAYAQLKALTHEARTNAKERRELFVAMNRWRHVSKGNFAVLRGGFQPQDEDVNQWFMQRLNEDTELGQRMRVMIQQQELRAEAALPLHMFEHMEAARDPMLALRMQTKNPLARRALRQLATHKPGPSDHILEMYLRSAARRQQPMEDLVKEFLQSEVVSRKQEDDDLRARKQQVLARIEGLRAKGDIIRLERTLFEAVLEGRPPRYLEEFEGWRALGLPMVVSPRLNLQNEQREGLARQAETAGDLNTRISTMLAFLRGQRADGVELVNNFLQVTEARGLDATADFRRQRDEVMRPQSEHLDRFFSPVRDGAARSPANDSVRTAARRKHVQDRLPEIDPLYTTR